MKQSFSKFRQEFNWGQPFTRQRSRKVKNIILSQTLCDDNVYLIQMLAQCLNNFNTIVIASSRCTEACIR